MAERILCPRCGQDELEFLCVNGVGTQFVCRACDKRVSFQNGAPEHYPAYLPHRVVWLRERYPRKEVVYE